MERSQPSRNRTLCNHFLPHLGLQDGSRESSKVLVDKGAADLPQAGCCSSPSSSSPPSPTATKVHFLAFMGYDLIAICRSG